MKPRIVLEAHCASYADSIEVANGAPLSLTGCEDVWDGHAALQPVWLTEKDERPNDAQVLFPTAGATSGPA